MLQAIDIETPVELQERPAARTQQYFAALINDAWRRGVEAFILVGQFLIDAKETLDHDEFEALVRLRLKFDASVGRRLMCIAADQVLCAHAHKLPACWTTIYELTKLDNGTLEAAIVDGRINPKMQRKDAVALRKPPPEESEGQPGPPPPPPPPPKPPSFAAVWDTAAEAAIRDKLDAVGRAGLCKIMSPELMAGIGDHVLGQTIRSASKTSSFAIKATDKLHTALRCAEQEKPSEHDIQTMVATLRCLARDAERRGLSRSDLVIGEGKSKPRKK